jgi:hypothetical protein
MAVNFGRQILGKVTIGIQDYFIVLNTIDQDSGQVQWLYYVTHGPAFIAMEEIIANGILDNYDQTQDPATHFAPVIAAMTTAVMNALAPEEKLTDWTSRGG